MIKANELKSGNLILSAFDRVETVRMILGHEGYKNNPDVHEIYKHCIGVEENGNQYNLAEIKPIELTEEWLNKTDLIEGLSIHNDHFSGIIKVKYNSFIGLYELYIGEINIKLLYHLHNLQNLIYDLTGQELTIAQ